MMHAVIIKIHLGKSVCYDMNESSKEYQLVYPFHYHSNNTRDDSREKYVPRVRARP